MNIIMEAIKIAVAFGVVALIGYGLAWFDGERRMKGNNSNAKNPYAKGGKGFDQV